MISLLGSVLEIIQKLRCSARGSVPIWSNCLENILINYFFLYVMLVAVCVTFLPISSSNLPICLFFVKSKDFLYKFSGIFIARWNSPGVVDSKI